MLQERIGDLRKKYHMSQEEMAQLFGVSRQSVQKWESGSTVPELDKLIAIARYFRLSLDELVSPEDQGDVEKLRTGRKIAPKYDELHDWEAYSAQLDIEYRQALEEGCDVTLYKKLFEAVNALPRDERKEQLADILFGMIMDAPPVEDYSYNEPSGLENIRKLSHGAQELPKPGQDLRNRIHGAWLGRIAGCLLGKPVEGIRTNELIPLLKETGNYPMHRYILASDLSEEIYNRYTFHLRGRAFADTVPCAPVDDDTNYTVLAGCLIEAYGRDFTPSDVARIWLDKQPKNAYCTAERVAFRNLVNGYQPPDSAKYKNPYREWIGAQIRGDYFGYINPGNPELAAEMAWRDASISHVKNGIYGEMFIAAMLAAAAVTNDLDAVIRCGMSQIPFTSRLHERIESILTNHKDGMTAAKCLQGIHERFDEHQAHDWCHTIPNAEIVIYALLYGAKDFGSSICMAVEAGFDTDCNGATVGSIVGMMLGAGGVPDVWTAPFHGKLDTSIFGVGIVSVEDMVETTMKHMP